MTEKTEKILGSSAFQRKKEESGSRAETAVGTLLISDLVDSTRLVETLGDQLAAEMFERHDRLARDLLVEHQGLEIDKTDGFLMLFERPVEAVAFALEYHAALAALSESLGLRLSARVGIHLGEVILHRNLPEDIARGAKPLELEGLAKPTVARLMGLARGGQTLLTQGAFDLARRAAMGTDSLRDELAWLDHGGYRFKGIAEPVRVYEVGRQGQAPLSPPPSSGKARRDATSVRIFGRRLKPGLVASIFAISALAAGVAIWQWPAPPPQPEAPAEPPVAEPPQVELMPRRVMVIPFENRTGDADLDSLKLIVADWLTQGLSRSGRLEIVPMALAVRSARFVAEQSGDEAAPPDLTLVARETGSGTVVSGFYYRQGEELVLRGQLTDVAAGRVISGLEPLRTPIDEPIGVLETLEQSVRTAVASHLDPQLAPMASLINQPPSYEAYEAYVEGLERFLELDFAAAIASWEVAGEIAPTFVTPQLWAATGYLNLGQFAAAQAIVERVSELRQSLAPLDRYNLDWVEANIRGDRTWAVQVSRRALELAPQSSWAQHLGVDSLRANLPRQALAALTSLDPERGPMRGWAPHFYYRTAARHLLADHELELRDARRGRRLYPGSLIVLQCEARALAALGRKDEIALLLEQATSMQREFFYTPGVVMTLVAYELEAHGHPRAARTTAENAIDWYRQLPGEEAGDPSSREGLARLMFFTERFEEAEKSFDALARELPEKLDYQGHLGVLAAIRGDPVAVSRILEELRNLNRPYIFGKEDYWQAVILAWKGENERAIEQFRRAISEGHPFEWPELHPHTDPMWRPLRDDPRFAELIEPKG